MKTQVLVTGAEGFIGRALVQALESAGCEVWRVDVTARCSERAVAVNLLDAAATNAALGRIPPCAAVVHLAALAHGQAPPAGETCFSTNCKITENLIAAVADWKAQFVFFSSIAVYGEDGREGPVPPLAPLRPATEYGHSKQVCEERILAQPWPNIDIVRLAPVFTRERLTDVRKRVFLPALPFRWRMSPSPEHSLCSLETVVQAVVTRVRRGPRGRTLANIGDPKPYLQTDLLTWFTGPVLPLPLAPTRLGYLLFRLVPGGLGYKLRSLYWKLFRSNTYSLEEVTLPSPR